ncbi:hypothetical protein [Nonomuraea sp. NPDC049129]|uniref:hypothetical protein n=1 Tax=Nonomuraea sp. NPDC049129 TaxID=3155272 RepID=UPI0033F7CBBA
MSDKATVADPTPEQHQHGEEQQHNEELTFNFNGRDTEWTDHLTWRQLTRRLPQLVRRSFALAWAVDRRAVIVLLVCQIISGLAEALGLLATTAALGALIQSAHDPTRLREALPSIVVLAGAAGLRALLGIAVGGLSNRLGPRIGREAEYRLLEAATNAEMAAYDHPGFDDRCDKADRGVSVSQDMIGESQNLVASLTTLIAATVVIATLAPVLLPLLVLTTVPQALASLAGERVAYLAILKTFQERRMLSMLRWHLTHKEQADQIRTDTLALIARWPSAPARSCRRGWLIC